jgi:hypothetical protein
VFWFSLQLLSETYLILRSIKRDLINIHVKYQLLLSDFKETWIFSTDFPKLLNYQNFIRIRPMEFELFHVDERKDMHTWTNRDYISIQHKLNGSYNQDRKCLLRGTNWTSISVVHIQLSCKCQASVGSIVWKSTHEPSSITNHNVTAPNGPEPPHYPGCTITLRHTTVGRTPLDEHQSDAETSTWQHTTLTRDTHP